jgi:ferredoxin
MPTQPITRETLFRQPLPATKELGVQVLKDLLSLGLAYHLDYSPDDIAGEEDAPLFSPEEAAFLVKLRDALNELFRGDVSADGQKVDNAGAWLAARQAGWPPDECGGAPCASCAARVEPGEPVPDTLDNVDLPDDADDEEELVDRLPRTRVTSSEDLQAAAVRLVDELLEEEGTFLGQELLERGD